MCVCGVCGGACACAIANSGGAGHKRFRLYSPEQWPYLYLFPRLHPSTRMSQVDPAVLELHSGVNVSAAFPGTHPRGRVWNGTHAGSRTHFACA